MASGRDDAAAQSTCHPTAREFAEFAPCDMLARRTQSSGSPLGQGAMPDPLRDQLQTSLGAAYTLGRELGAGGMSRVFVAREETLGRDVVVKVLAPELAAD